MIESKMESDRKISDGESTQLSHSNFEKSPIVSPKHFEEPIQEEEGENNETPPKEQVLIVENE
jgi:hypothetical protein